MNQLKLLLISMFLTFSVFGQNENRFFIKSFEPDLQDKNCLDQISRCQKDFDLGKIKIELKTPIPFSNTVQKLFKLEFNILIEYPQVFIENCYNYHMIELMNRKYGFDVFEYMKKKADSLDNIGFGNRSEKFNYNNLFEYLKLNLSKNDFNYLEKKYGETSISVMIEIDENGVCNVGKIYVYPYTIISEPKLSNLINLKRLYQPKIENGIQVKTWNVITINFKD